MCLSLSLFFLSNILHGELRQARLYIGHMGRGRVPGTTTLRLGGLLNVQQQMGAQVLVKMIREEAKAVLDEWYQILSIGNRIQAKDRR